MDKAADRLRFAMPTRSKEEWEAKQKKDEETKQANAKEKSKLEAELDQQVVKP